MNMSFLKASTALSLVLTVATPSQAQTSLETILADPGNAGLRPVCADGTALACADGSVVRTFGELGALGDVEGSSGFAICAGGETAICQSGAPVLVPGDEGYDRAVAAIAAELEVAEAAPATEPDSAPEVAADPTEEREPLPQVEPEVSAETAETEESPPAEPDAAPEVAAEPADTREPLPQIEPEGPAGTAEAEEVPPEEPAAEVAESEAGTLETEGTMATEGTLETDGSAEAPVEVPSGEVAEVPAETPTEETVDVLPETLPEQATEPPAETAEQTPPEPPAETTVDTGAEARITADTPETDAPLTADTPPQAPEPDSPVGEDTQRVIDTIAEALDPEAGGEATVPDALAETGADATATTETEVTEADTRQSDEDFATDAAGNDAAAATPAEDDDSDLARAALIGLGALAVGAVLANGDEVVANTGDRVVVRRGEGSDDFYVLKDDDTLLRQPGTNVRTESFADGSTRTTVTREDGTSVITIRDAAGRVVYRAREAADGIWTVLIDDTVTYETVELETLPQPEEREVAIVATDVAAIRAALEEASARGIDRSFSLRQIRDIEAVRKLVPAIALEEINFETASAAIEPEEAEELSQLGTLMTALIADNPGEIFLIEGHTDAVGGAAYNLALSDRRAESVALALTEYFDVEPENMVVQGYGESDLKVATEEAERANRRVTVRRITPLLSDRVARN